MSIAVNTRWMNAEITFATFAVPLQRLIKNLYQIHRANGQVKCTLHGLLVYGSFSNTMRAVNAAPLVPIKFDHSDSWANLNLLDDPA
jgi:hypothetical protein